MAKVKDTLAPKRTLRRLFYECERISNTGGPYVYGGGHGKPLAQLHSSEGLDCSSSVSLALWRAGFYTDNYATNSTGFMTWGKPGRGKKFTVYASSQHVWIQFESRGLKHWRFDTSPWGYGGSGPRLRWTKRGISGFVARHYSGS